VAIVHCNKARSFGAHINVHAHGGERPQDLAAPQAACRDAIKGGFSPALSEGRISPKKAEAPSS